MILESIITCPRCSTAKLEMMSTDACQFFYVCTGCDAKLRPESGDCCVFCSYGSVPCPPMQSENAISCCSTRPKFKLLAIGSQVRLATYRRGGFPMRRYLSACLYPFSRGHLDHSAALDGRRTLDAAHGLWPDILTSFGIPPSALGGKHHPCPSCGGKDRFCFTDRHGDGDYYCNGCGAGKGISLVMKVNGWDYAEAAKRVDEIIGNVKLAA
jgi:hypothetical protein